MPPVHRQQGLARIRKTCACHALHDAMMTLRLIFDDIGQRGATGPGSSKLHVRSAESRGSGAAVTSDPHRMNAAAPDATQGLHRYRAIFISDLHLGTRGCRSDFLADFLRRTSSEKLYLVGDIIDGWRLRKSWYWDATHDEVLKLILRKARNCTEVTYIDDKNPKSYYLRAQAHSKLKD
jgi:hypothetical protein